MHPGNRGGLPFGSPESATVPTAPGIKPLDYFRRHLVGALVRPMTHCVRWWPSLAHKGKRRETRASDREPKRAVWQIAAATWRMETKSGSEFYHINSVLVVRASQQVVVW